MKIIVHDILFIFLVVFLVEVSIYATFARNVSHDNTDNMIDIFSVGRSFPDSVPASEIEYLGSPYPEREQGKVEDDIKRETSPEYTGVLPSQYPRENTDNIATFPNIAPDNDGSLRKKEVSPYEVPTYIPNTQNNVLNKKNDDIAYDIPSIYPSEIVDTIDDTPPIVKDKSVPEEIILPERIAGIKGFEYQEQEETKAFEIQNPTLVPFVNNKGYEIVETMPRTPPETTAEIDTPQSLPEAEMYVQNKSNKVDPTILPTTSYPEDYTHVSVPKELPDSIVTQEPEETTQQAVVENILPDNKVVQEPDKTYNSLMQRNSEDAIVVSQIMQGQFIQIASSKDLSQTKVLYNSVNLQSDSVLAINNLIRIWKDPSSEYFRLVIGPFNKSDIGLQLYKWRKYFSDAFTYSHQNSVQ